MTGFTTELARAKREGVTHPENLPFLFEPQKPNGKALLLIHGFAASPYEMRPLGERLCSRGYLALGVRLAGHGTTPEDLRSCRWQDWFKSAERGYSILQGSDLPISLIGQSTGSLLALALTQQKDLESLVLLSPFLKLRHPLAEYIGLLKYLFPFQKRQLPHPENLHYYERRPLAGIAQILRLRDKITPLLSQLEAPTLVLSAAGDQTVASGSGLKLFKKLGGSHKEFHLFGPDVPHVLSTKENPEWSSACRMIEDFLAKYAPSARPKNNDSIR